jgi:hypothetical protein
MKITERKQVSGNAGIGEVVPDADMTVSIIRAVGNDSRETSEAYRGELFRIGCHHVAVCRDAVQWLYQRQRPSFASGGTAWTTLGYCVTRNVLRRLHHFHTGTDAPEISALPERCKTGENK